MPISEADVRHVMTLARLSLPQEQVHKLTTDLQAILVHVESLKQVDCPQVASSNPGNEGPLPAREDNCVDGGGARGLAGSSGLDGTLVRVPRIME